MNHRELAESIRKRSTKIDEPDFSRLQSDIYLEAIVEAFVLMLMAIGCMGVVYKIIEIFGQPLLNFGQ